MAEEPKPGSMMWRIRETDDVVAVENMEGVLLTSLETRSAN